MIKYEKNILEAIPDNVIQQNYKFQIMGIWQHQKAGKVIRKFNERESGFLVSGKFYKKINCSINALIFNALKKTNTKKDEYKRLIYLFRKQIAR